MNDLIERLRDYYEHSPCACIREAADEIERRTAERDIYHDQYVEEKAEHEATQGDVQRLRADYKEAAKIAVEKAEECGRLRAALEEIKWKSCHKDNMEFTATISCYHMDRIREALNPSTTCEAHSKFGDACSGGSPAQATPYCGQSFEITQLCELSPEHEGPCRRLLSRRLENYD